MKRLLLMLAIAGLIGGAGVSYVRRNHAPSKDLTAAREEIERWELRANRARECLLGTAPASPFAAEALAIRELTNHAPEYKACKASIADLARAPGGDTAIKEVEDAWRNLGRATSGLAKAFAYMFVPGTHAQNAIDELGEALDTLDLAHSNLRQAAGLDPEPSGTNAKRSLDRAELIALGTAKRAKLAAWLRPSAGGMVALVEGAGRPAQQLVLIPGQAPRRVPYKPEVRPSITDPAWAIEVRAGQLAHGTLKADGSANGTTLAKVSDGKALPQALFTLGTAAAGATAYLPDPTRTPPLLGIARLRDGAFELGTPVEADDYAFALAPPDRGLVAWSSKGTLRGLLVAPPTPTPAPPPGAVAMKLAPPPPPVDLGAGHAGLACLTASHGWVTSGDAGERFVAFDATRALPVALPDHELIACDATSVLLRQAGHRYAVCTIVPGVASPTPPNAASPPPIPPPQASCRTVDLPAGADALPALAGGKVIAVAVRQRVIAIWREHAEPRFVVMPATLKPKLVQATATLVEVVGEAEDGLAVARAAL